LPITLLGRAGGADTACKEGGPCTSPE
jgi:hypothetical protein